MRKLLLLPLVIILSLIACQKEVSDVLPDALIPNDPKSISLAIKVWHGIRSNGNLPTATGDSNAPILDSASNDQTIKAIAGRYAIIKPEVVSGSVAGYYVQVNGAPDYFKVDYSKPRNIGGRLSAPDKSHKVVKRVQRFFNTDSTGNLDSMIVIVLPQTIQPGKFCITYIAFDSSGKLSNSIGACIDVQSFGGDASVSYLNGLWHNTEYKYDTSQIWHPVIGSDSSYSAYTCVNNKLTPFCPTTNCSFTNLSYYIYITYKSDITFGSNGGLKYDEDSEQKSLDFTQTTCNSLVYHTQTDTADMYGGWSYSSSTNKLLMIFDFNVWGEPEPFVAEYTIEKINDNLFYLHNPTYGQSQKFER